MRTVTIQRKPVACRFLHNEKDRWRMGMEEGSRLFNFH